MTGRLRGYRVVVEGPLCFLCYDEATFGFSWELLESAKPAPSPTSPSTNRPSMLRSYLGLISPPGH